jgi:hypothetical protein
MAKLEVSFDYDFHIIGLVCSLKEYKMAYYINKHIDFRLVKAEDLEYKLKNDSTMLISNYLYKNEYSEVRLVKNKSIEFTNIAKPFIAPEFKTFDYFIYVFNEGAGFEIDAFIEQISLCTNIEYIRKIDVSELKSKDNFIFN